MNEAVRDHDEIAKCAENGAADGPGFCEIKRLFPPVLRICLAVDFVVVGIMPDS
jgi:hypothetical protein